MKGGICTEFKVQPCTCGSEASLIWHYINGTANRVHYFVRCNECRKRTRDRKAIAGALSEWADFQAPETTSG